MDTPERMTRARTRDAVLALACYLGVLVYSCFGAIVTMNYPWGSSTAEVVILGILIGFSVGLAFSGMNGTRRWARVLSAVVMMLSLVQVFEPRLIHSLLAALL